MNHFPWTLPRARFYLGFLLALLLPPANVRINTDVIDIAERRYTKCFDSLSRCPAGYTESISVWKGSGMVVLDMRNFEDHRYERFVPFDSIREARAQIRDIVNEIRQNRCCGFHSHAPLLQPAIPGI